MPESGPIMTSDPDRRLVRTSLGQIALTDEGPETAPVVFCLHGIPGSVRDFRYLAPHLRDDFRVIRLDMPGFGESPIGPNPSIERWSKVPTAVADALGIRHFYLLSHSFGGSAVIHAAAREGLRVRGIALLASNGARRHRAWTLPPFVFGLMRTLLEYPRLAPKLFEFGSHQYEKLRLPLPDSVEELHTQLAVMATQRFRAIGELVTQVRCPALVAFCRDDRLIEVEIARELASFFPCAEVLEFETGGHYLQKHRAREIAVAFCRLFT